MEAMDGSTTEALAALLARPRFEVVPIRGVEEQVRYLAPGSTVTVTCSPTRGIDRSVDCALRLAALGYRVVPHLSARLVRNRGHLRRLLAALHAAGIDEVFVIGGDSSQPQGPYGSALRLLPDLRDLAPWLTSVGVAAYPEPHPLILQAEIEAALLAKQRYASYCVTQICFDPARVTSWLSRVRPEGMTLPAYVGIPGVVDRAHLLRIALKVGVGESTRFLRKHTGLVARLFGPGTYGPQAFVTALAPNAAQPEYSIKGLHINTFNRVEATERWRRSVLRGETPPRLGVPQ